MEVVCVLFHYAIINTWPIDCEPAIFNEVILPKVRQTSHFKRIQRYVVTTRDSSSNFSLLLAPVEFVAFWVSALIIVFESLHLQVDF